MIVARAPLRVSFGGGGTDLPAYYERYGGLVVSAAIQAACHVHLGARQGRDIVVESRDYGRTITLAAREPVTIAEPLSLPRAVVAWFAGHGMRPEGACITMRADVPPGTGLGSSSAMAAALVAAMARHVRLPLTQRMIAEIACEVEIGVLRRPIGRQDQYASALGGVNTLTFATDGVTVSPLRLPPEAERALQAHLLLLSTGKAHDSATILCGQRDASASDGEVTQRLHRLKELAIAMRDALHQGDMAEFGALMDASWQLKRGLTRGVTSADIDYWYQTARDEGAFGGKICGAGGGGFLLLCVPPDRHEGVTAALVRAGLTPLPLHFDHRGCLARDEMIVREPRSRHALKGMAHETASAGQL